MATSEPNFVRRELFGGAITACIPVEFVDISAVRAVPDNQECYAHQDTDRSLIVEILEYETGQSDKDAPAFFFGDLAEANGSQKTEIQVTEGVAPEIAMPSLAAGDASHVGIAIGTQLVSKFRESAANSIRVFLADIRLPKYSTDILVSLNVPVALDPHSSSAEAMQAAGVSFTDSPDKQAEEMLIFRRFLATFVIANPGLFGS